MDEEENDLLIDELESWDLEDIGFDGDIIQLED